MKVLGMLLGNMKDVLKVGGHYVVVLLSDDLWQQLQAMIAPLRGPLVHREIPVIVVCRFEAPLWLRSKFTKMFWILGNPNVVANLDKVRALSCLLSSKYGGFQAPPRHCHLDSSTAP